MTGAPAPNADAPLAPIEDAGAAPAARYFVALDSWRGVCATLVAMGHLKTSGLLSRQALLLHSYRFVDFFFVLSGFVISHAARDGLCGSAGNVRGFLIRRVGRLWPLHVAMLGGFLAYELVLLAVNHAGIDVGRVAFEAGGKTDPHYLPANLAMVQAWDILPQTTWNVPAWSISAEFAAYLVFALAFAVLRMRGMILLLGLGVAGGIVILSAGETGMAATSDLGVARCLLGFSAGSLAYWLWRLKPLRRLPAATWTELTMLAVTLAAVCLLPPALGILIVPVFTATVYVFAHEDGALARLLRRGPARFLGERSYSIYMVHYLIATCILSVAAIAPKLHLRGIRVGAAVGAKTGVVGPQLAMDELLIGFVLLTILVSTLTYRWIEAPSRRAAGRLARRIDARGLRPIPAEA